MSGQISATQALAHDGSFSTQCSNVNSGYSGEIVTTCYLGSLVVNSTQCHPSPCAAGSAATVTLANVDSTHNSQAITAHDGSYSANCADHGDFYGSFQVTCAYGALTVDTSTCVENPCLSSASAEVNVGGITASRSPAAEVVHGSTWTAPCIDINWDYAGDVHMSCDKGHVGYDNSSCILMELGCQTTGGENITVGNYTWVLQPSSNVLKDESFQVDCASHTEQKFVGEIRVTCGRLGNYSSVEDLCAPKSCSAGVDLSVTFRGLTGSITTSSALAHLQSETASCESINEVLRGDLRIDCQYGEPIVDTSSCYMVCLPSRPATVVFAGATRSIATPQELEDGKGFFKPCSDYGGYTGSISASCNAGALEVDVSACEGLPCASGASLALTLYDATQNLTLTQELAHGSSQSFGCNTVNSDYAGDATLTCQAQVLQLDSSVCSCQAQACSSAPCGASATYSVQLSGLLSTPVLGEELQSLTSTTRSCASAVEGLSGDISILCSGGVLKADASLCSPLGCDATTTPVEVVVGGSTRSISATQAMLHGEHFVADSCSNVDSGYEGSINVTCYLGTLMSSSCRPKPCEDTVKYVTHAGLNLLARLNGDSLGSTSPAPSGFEGTGDCGIFDTQLVGTFSVSCLASEYTLDLGSCFLNTCDLPSAALVHLGSVSKAVSLQTANAEKGTESFDCADVSSDYSGQGQLVCLDGRLYSSVSGCSSSVASACSAAARAPTEKDGVWTIYDPSGALEHGQSESVSCENLLGFVGTATASCSRGIFSVDVSACEPKTCSSSMSASVQLGSNSYSVQSSAEVQSGSSWTVACSSFDTQYEGDIQVTCLRGEILAASGCKELSCGSVVRQLTYSGESVNVELSASTLMETPETRTPSNFSNSSVHCSALASVLSGSASVSCLKGAYTLDASACAPKDCAAGDMKTPMGSREITLTVDQSLPHAGSSTRSCASVMYGWAGTFTTGCNFTTLLPDSSGCSPASCAQGQGVTVVVGSTVAQTTIPQQLESYASTKMDCASFDVGFAGNISIRCEAAVLLTDVSGCSPVVQEGQVQQAVQVVESAVAFALPTIQGATQAELEAAMESPSTKRAYAATLAASLGVANEEDVIILFIQVLESVAADGRRLSDRRLAGSFEVNVNFQLRTNSDEDDVAAGFASKIQSLGDSSSSEQQIFATTLGANLQAAAAEDPSTSLLQEAAQAVQDTGIQVKHTETPRVAVNYVAVEDTNVTATGQVDALTNDDTTALLVALIAGCIGAFMAGLCCAWKVTKHMRKKKQESFFTENESNQVASLPEDHDLSPEMFTWDQPGPPPPEVFVDAPRSPGGQKAPDPKMETFEEEEEVEKENEVQTAYLGTKEAEGEGTDIDELVEAYLGDKKSIEEASGSNEDTSQTVADTPRETSSSSSVPQEQRLQTALSSLPPAAEANEEDSDAEINLDLQVAKF